jgi:hypothetical protein
MVLLAWMAIGCSSHAREHPEISGTDPTSWLARIQVAHGGRERWSRYAGLTFRYRAIFAGETAIELPLTIVFDDPERIWTGEESNGSPAELAWAAVELRGGRVRPVPAVWRSSLARVPPLSIDFALRSTRNVFSIPFGLGQGGWQVHAPIASSRILRDWLPVELQIVPPGPASDLGPYVLPLAEAIEAVPIEKIYYASCHPAQPGAVFELILDEYVEVQGIALPTRLRHFRRNVDPLRDEAPDPLEWIDEPGGRTAPPDRPDLEERIEDARFLLAEELAARLGPKSSTAKGEPAVPSDAARS